MKFKFFGILSSDPSQNPDFFDWNKVKIRYCDGGSFSGHPDSEFKNGTKLFFRGQLIWEAVMDELLSMGLSNAKHFFRDVLLEVWRLSYTAMTFERFYPRMPMSSALLMQDVAKSLKKDCTSRLEPYKCFFPQEFISNIKTPVFLVNPGYDFWQIQNILVPGSSDPDRIWVRCKLNINNCNSRQLEVLQDFRNSLLKMLNGFNENPEGGMFINSCFIHCQTWMTETWHSPRSPKISNKTIAEAVGDWYFKRKAAKHIDCPFPCNPTCYHMDFTRG